MRDVLLVMFFLAMCSPSIPGATHDFEKLRWMRGIVVPPDAGAGEVGSLVLDSPVYDSIAADFSDIRLIGKDGAVVPFVIKQQFVTEKTKREVVCPSEVVSVKKLESNRLEVVVKRKDTAAPVLVFAIDTPTVNFEKLVTVFGSDDGSAWREIIAGQAIFDYSRIIDLAKRGVDLPATNHLYYKALIDNFTESKPSQNLELIKESRLGKDFSALEKTSINAESMRINGVVLRSRIEELVDGKQSRREYPMLTWRMEEKAGSTVLTLAARREPLVSLEVMTQMANFSRNVILSGGDNGTDWTEITRSRITKLKLAGLDKNETSVPFSERRFKHYQLTIENGDSPPLSISSIKAFGNVYCLEFLTAGLDLGGLTLYYGGERIERPNYDLKDVLGPLKTASVVCLGFADPLPNPTFMGKVEKRQFLDQRWLFYGAVLLAVVVLAFALFKAMRKIEGAAPTDGDGSAS